MRKLKGVKLEVVNWNKVIFGNVLVKCAELENKIRMLDEREAKGDWSSDLNERRREAKSELGEFMFTRYIIDSQKAKVR